jgi:tetratricopeptide (TPR) repeat protein
MNAKLIFVCLLFLMYLNSGQTQEITLRGQASIHNSLYNTDTLEYVSNVFVSAPYTTSGVTDSEGKFKLVFTGVPEGTSIALSAEKAGYEIVNQRDLLHVVLGRKMPLRIFLAEKGQLAKRQTELYHISLDALTKQYDEAIDRLRREGADSQAEINALEQQLNREIADRFEAEQLLTEQLEQLKRKLPKFAKDIATVNLDFASQRYRQAYRLFQAGEIEKAIEVLDEAILDAEAEAAVQQLDSLSSYIDDITLAIDMNSEALHELAHLLQLKGQSLYRLQQYQDAIAMNKKAIYLLEYHQLNDTTLANLYWASGQMYQEINKNEASLAYKLKGLQGFESFPQPAFLRKAYRGYLDISRHYESIQDLENAITYYKKALAFQQLHFPQADSDFEARESKLMSLISAYAAVLDNNKAYEKAIQYLEMLLELEPEKKEARRIRKRIKQLKKLR